MTEVSDSASGGGGGGETPIALGAGIEEEGLDRASRYVVERWSELGDPHAPWWTRSQGMGIRLRLKELLDIADARHEGATLDRPVSILREEAHAALFRESSFLAERHKPISDQIRAALDVERTDPLPPEGVNYSIIEAAFRVLDEPALREAIIDVLCERAGNADNFRMVSALDDLIELLDGELAYDGHPAQWRHRVALDAKAKLHGGMDLKDAILSAIGEAESGWPKVVRILVPVTVRRAARRSAVGSLLDAEDIRARLSAWLGSGPVIDGFELEDAGFSFELEDCADEDAAVRRADEWLGEQLALYDLQGGDLEAQDGWLLVDESAGTQLVGPPAPLTLMPEGLERHKGSLGRDPTRRREAGPFQDVLTDALVQLAQARRGSDGASLSDIWTVIEAVFAGAATEPRHLAGEVVSELLEYLYPLALLEWMAPRIEAAGLNRDDETRSPASWALDKFANDASRLFGVIEEHDDPLLYVRAKAIGRWSRTDGQGSTHMREELTAVCERCKRVAVRAYLVRNLQVHRAQPQRATALGVTLPIFAEMARIALGYVTQHADSALPITTAKLAMLRIRQVAWDFETGHGRGASPLGAALGEDLRSEPSRPPSAHS